MLKIFNFLSKNIVISPLKSFNFLSIFQFSTFNSPPPSTLIYFKFFNNKCLVR